MEKQNKKLEYLSIVFKKDESRDSNRAFVLIYDKTKPRHLERVQEAHYYQTIQKAKIKYNGNDEKSALKAISAKKGSGYIVDLTKKEIPSLLERKIA